MISTNRESSLKIPNLPRAWKLALLAPVLFAVLTAASVLSPKARTVIVRAYFRAETAWVDHWPFGGDRWAIQTLTPYLCRIGFLGPARVKVEPGLSLLLDPRDLVSVTILRTRAWQPEIWDSLSPALAEGGVFLDVGAHIGYFSMKAAPKVGKTGRVVAFEPNPETLELLRGNVTANHASNVTVMPVACTDKERTLTLYASPIENTGASSLSRDNAAISANAGARAYTTRGRPIDDVVNELNLARVDAIKIDVEGAELSVLRGAFQTLKRFHPKLVLEVIPSQLAAFQSTPEDLTKLLKEAGYDRARPLNPEKADWEWTSPREATFLSALRVADPYAVPQLLRGFHAVEANAWRWTDARFVAALRPPPGASRAGARLVLKFAVPEVSIKKLGPITLSAGVGGAALAPQTFATSGEREYRRDVPPSALNKEVVEADFSLDKFLLPSEGGNTQLGLIVTSLALETLGMKR